MTDVILVYHKVKEVEGQEMHSYFGYHQQKSMKDGVETFTDDVNPVTGKRCKSIKVRFANSFKEKHPLEDMTFPCYVEVDMKQCIKIKDKDGVEKEVNMCYIKPDTDKEGKAKRSKDGRRFPICVIHDALSLKEAPRRVISWDDIDDFE